MSKYNQSVIYAVIQNLGYEPDMGDEARARYEQRIEHMSPAEVWECWCNWNGFINWCHQLHLAHDSVWPRLQDPTIAQDLEDIKALLNGYQQMFGASNFTDRDNNAKACKNAIQSLTDILEIINE